MCLLLGFDKEAMDKRKISFEKKLEERPTLDELCEHIHIVDKWHQFGIILKLDPKKLNAIEQQPVEASYKTLKMFELWLNTNPYATRQQVIDALKKGVIEENTIAHKYEQTLKQLCISIGEWLQLVTLLLSASA